MKLGEVQKVFIGDNEFGIHPFSAMVAANISGDVLKVALPIISSILPTLQGGTISIDANVLAQGVEQLNGDIVEKLLRKLLLDKENIAVRYKGEPKRLTEKLMDELFCGNAEELYILAYHVIMVNYSGFFKKLGIQYGNAEK